MARQPDSFIPLPTPVFHILVAVADRERHGYAIMQDVAARTAGKLRMSPGTLYGSIKRMLEDGFIEELEERPDPEHDDTRSRRPGPAARLCRARQIRRPPVTGRT